MQTKKYDFDDILIEPAVMSQLIQSRYKDIKLPKVLPIFTAPMDTVVDINNIQKFLDLGIMVVIPRTIKYSDVKYYSPKGNKYVFCSLSLEDVKYELTVGFSGVQKYGSILIDVANGHQMRIIYLCKDIKKIRPDITIMVGNIANPEAYKVYAQNECVDYIRIIVGSGSGCLTSKNCGVGFPPASLIAETYEVRESMIRNNAKNCDSNHTPAYNNERGYHIIKNYPKIVADGGMKDYADVIKALNLGADMVMCGGIFNKALESAGYNYFKGIKINYNIANWLFNHGFTIKKHFRGMSTKGAQKAMGKTKFKTSEGVVRYRKVEYHLDGWMENFEHYLRSAMSYSDCQNLQEFIGKGNIIQITEKAYDRFNK